MGRFRTESGWCTRCRKQGRSRHPGQVSSATGAAGGSLGPRAKALAAERKPRLGIPYGKLAALVQTAFGLAVTAGGLCQADERLAKKAEPVYEDLLQAIRRSAAVHADETGWLWVFTNQTITVYTLNERRSPEVVVELLGRQFASVVVADCFLASDHAALSEWLQQRCCAPFLRELSKLAREKSRGAVRFPRELAALLREALALRDERLRLAAAAFAAKVQQLEVQLDALTAESRRLTDPDNARFAKRLRKQRRHLLTFLPVEGVGATTNRAERALRPAVIVRKTGGCNKTPRGVRPHAMLASLLVTLRQQGREALDYPALVLTSPAEPPTLLAVPGFDTS